MRVSQRAAVARGGKCSHIPCVALQKMLPQCLNASEHARLRVRHSQKSQFATENDCRAEF